MVALFSSDITVCMSNSTFESCAAFSFWNATNIIFSKIIVAVYTHTSAIVVVNVSKIAIHLTIVYSMFKFEYTKLTTVLVNSTAA